MDIPSKEDVLKRSAIYNSSFVKRNYPEFYNFLINKYQFTPTKFTELLYLYFNNIDYRPTCPMCGGILEFRCYSKGYREFCSIKCQRNSPKIREKIKQTCLNKYGEDCPSKSYIIKEKVKNTNMSKYGVENSFQSDLIKEKIKRIKKERYGDENFRNHDKVRKTKKERYGDENFMNHNKARKTCLKKYGVDHPWKYKPIRDKLIKNSNKIQNKIYLTKKKNNTFNTSKIEQDFKQWLIENNINFIYQYKNDKYPFNCDFYFPDKDFYLEIQGNWTHGKHPYDPNNEDDVRVLNEWSVKKEKHKYHEIAIHVWTISDPQKREIAKKNKLNWMEVFTNDINELIDKVKTLII